MPTRVVLDCPKCGRIKVYNYSWPDEQAKEQTCPFCSGLSEFISCEVVPRAGDPKVIEPADPYKGPLETMTVEETHGKVSKGRKRRNPED